MAKIVLRFIGFMYLEDPVRIFWTMILLALSEGWNPSQNAYKSLFGHRLENTVHSPIPLYGPCPQHAIFDVTNPVRPITLKNLFSCHLKEPKKKLKVLSVFNLSPTFVEREGN